MNVRREFQSRLFEILKITPRLMSKADLDKEILEWLKRNCTNNVIHDGIVYINTDKFIELTGLPVNTQYNLRVDGWRNFVTRIYKKFIVRN